MDTEEKPQVPPEKIGAFFDVDQTLVRGASAFWAAKEMFRRSFLGMNDLAYAARQTLKYVMFGEDKDNIGGFSSRAAQVVAGKDVEELQRVGEEIFERYFVPKVYRGTYDILREHVDAGHQVYLVSATPWLIAEEFARRIGAAGGIGTKTKVHEGKIVGELEGDLIHGQAKVDAVLEVAAETGIDLSESWAYSDSANDIPMLSLVGHPVAVNPDRALRAYARANGWPQFKAYERKDVVKQAVVRGVAGAAVGVGVYAAWNAATRRRALCETV